MKWDIISDNIDIIEEAFPLPETEAIVNMGTISVFTDSEGTLKTTLSGATFKSDIINAINAILMFDLQTSSHWDVIINVLAKNHISILPKDQQRFIPKQWFDGGRRYYVNIGIADYVEGQITAHDPSTNALGKPIDFSVSIKRSDKVLGVGTFIMPVLPVAIVYCPPQGKKGKNNVTYTASHSVGTSIETSYQTEESITKPVSPSYYESINKIRPCITSIKSIGSSLPLVKTACDVLLSGMGSADASDTKGFKKIENSKAVFNNEELSEIRTQDNGMPGRDDIICIIKNASVGWWSYENQLRLTFLGGEAGAKLNVNDLQNDLNLLEQQTPEQIIPVSSGDPEFPINPISPDQPKGTSKTVKPQAKRVEALHEAVNIHELGQRFRKPLEPVLTTGPISGLPENYIRNLLALDPFVKDGTSVELKEPRFIPALIEGCHQIEVSPGIAYYIYKVEYSLSTEDMYIGEEFNSHIEEYKSGWLKFLGMGVEEDKKIISSTRYSVCRQSSIGKTITSSLYIEPAIEDSTIALVAYFDRAFGTFAFQEVPVLQVPWYSNIAMDSNGSPIANANVELNIGGKKLLTRTDKQGRFAFYSSGFPKGKALIKFGTFSKNINLK